MPHKRRRKLKNLKVSRVDLVDKGANLDLASGEGSHVVFFKREEPMPDVTKAATVDEVMAVRQFEQEWFQLQDAFWSSVQSILMGDKEDQAKLLLRTAKEFSARAKAILPKVEKSDEKIKAVEDIDLLITHADATEDPAVLAKDLPELAGIFKQEETMPDPKKGQKEDLQVVVDALKKSNEELVEKNDQLAKANTELGVELTKLKTDKDPEGDVKKAREGLSKDVRKQLEDQDKRLANQSAVIQKMQDDKEREVFVAKAAGYTFVAKGEKFAEILRLASKAMPTELFAELERIFASVDETMKQSLMLKSVGTSSKPGDSGTAANEVLTKAQEIIAEGKVTRMDKAIDIVMQQHPELYARHQAEKN